MQPWHEHALDVSLARLSVDPAVAAVLLQGSVARGDANPGADVDLVVVLAEGRTPGFRHGHVAGVRVEEHRASLAELRAKLASRPGIAYGLTEAHLVYGPSTIEGTVREMARDALATFHLDGPKRTRLAYWLTTSAEKCEAAAEQDDWARAALIADATLWPLLEGLWGANDLPAPPVGNVLSRLSTLPHVPPNVEEAFQRLLLGNAQERVAAFTELATWVASALESGLQE